MNYLMQVKEKLQSSVLSTEESKSLKGKGCGRRGRRGDGCGRRSRRGSRSGGGCSGGGTTIEQPISETTKEGSITIGTGLGAGFDL